MKKIFSLLLFSILSGLTILYSQDVIATVTHESTVDADDGSIALTTTAGYSPYTFAWSGPFGFTSAASTES